MEWFMFLWSDDAFHKGGFPWVFGCWVFREFGGTPHPFFPWLSRRFTLKAILVCFRVGVVPDGVAGTLHLFVTTRVHPLMAPGVETSHGTVIYGEIVTCVCFC